MSEPWLGIVNSLLAISVVLPALSLAVVAGAPVYGVRPGVCAIGWIDYQYECEARLLIVVWLALWVAGAALTWTLLVLKGWFGSIGLQDQTTESRVVVGHLNLKGQ